DGLRAQLAPVVPGYFGVLGLPVLEGRAIESSDIAGGLPVIVLDRQTARALWPQGRAVGKRLRFDKNQPWMTVVGIVSDVAEAPLVREDARFRGYIPIAQQPQVPPLRVFAVRTAGDSEAVLPAIRAVVRNTDPDIKLQNPTTVEASYDT